MASPDHDPTRQLLAEGTALRRLARSLLGGHADAEDLVQDTLVASLRSPCADAGKRPWLSGTLRNLALLWRRTSTRRVNLVSPVLMYAEAIVLCMQSPVNSPRRSTWRRW